MIARTRHAALAAGLALLAAGAVAVAPGASATERKPPPAARVDVAGAGTLTRPRVAVRTRPDATAPTVATLRQFRPDFRNQYVLALEARRDDEGKPAWYRISVPGRPNGRTGWVPAGALELRPVTRRLIVYRAARRFELWDGSRLVRQGRVAVGKRGAETPLGLFYVTWKFKPTAPILGAYALETSAYSRLTDWPGGGVVGVHGTPWPELLGQAVSSGCVRLHNRDILFLRSRVPLGMPVKIVR